MSPPLKDLEGAVVLGRNHPLVAFLSDRILGKAFLPADPLMEDRLAGAEKATTGQDLVQERKAKEQAILSMSVCDPACGSGHFLLAAAWRLGKERVRLRTGEDEPRPEEFHLAVRDVISHCIYGVDLNPLAVDLCKLALWLEGHWIGKPLSFLDHRIRCGNSLVGILDPEVMAEGIPDEAFKAITGDDKKIAACRRRALSAFGLSQRTRFHCGSPSRESFREQFFRENSSTVA